MEFLKHISLDFCLGPHLSHCHSGLALQYYVRALSLKVVSGCAIFDASSVILFTDHIASHVNQYCSTSSLSVPWNMGNLRVLSRFTILDLELCPLDYLGSGNIVLSEVVLVYFTCHFSSFLSYSCFYSNQFIVRFVVGYKCARVVRGVTQVWAMGY
jgi:hypothetical protein